MFDIEYIRKITQRYRFEVNNRQINYNEIAIKRHADIGIVASPEQLSPEEKRQIRMALFLGKIIQETKSGGFYRNSSDEQILCEIQTQFPADALLMSIFSGLVSIMDIGTPVNKILTYLVSTDESKSSIAKEYLQYVLSQFGRTAVNIEILKEAGVAGNIGQFIQYDTKKINNGNELPTNSVIYTTFLKKYMKKVEEMIEEYRIAEEQPQHSNWRQIRQQNEKNDKQRVAQYVAKYEKRKSVPINIVGQGLFRLLIAAQELNSLDIILRHKAVKQAIRQYARSEIRKQIYNEYLSLKRTESGRKPY